MRPPFRDLAGARTQDPYIKSVLLYQLSYQIVTLTRVQIYTYISLKQSFLNKKSVKKSVGFLLH